MCGLTGTRTVTLEGGPFDGCTSDVSAGATGFMYAKTESCIALYEMDERDLYKLHFMGYVDNRGCD